MYLGETLSSVVQIMDIQFTIGGVTFSMWQVFLFSIVGSILAWILGEIFG